MEIPEIFRERSFHVDFSTVLIEKNVLNVKNLFELAQIISIYFLFILCQIWILLQ